ncbi:hypothetical protein C0993_000785, partial [Termitomyces sp. T159_Od127]
KRKASQSAEKSGNYEEECRELKEKKKKKKKKNRNDSERKLEKGKGLVAAEVCEKGIE